MDVVGGRSPSGIKNISHVCYNLDKQKGLLSFVNPCFHVQCEDQFFVSYSLFYFWYLRNVLPPSLWSALSCFGLLYHSNDLVYLFGYSTHPGVLFCFLWKKLDLNWICMHRNWRSRSYDIFLSLFFYLRHAVYQLGGHMTWYFGFWLYESSCGIFEMVISIFLLATLSCLQVPIVVVLNITWHVKRIEIGVKGSCEPTCDMF